MLPPSWKCVIDLFPHQSVQPQGCSSPIVVKFADTQKDKEQRRLQQQLAQQMQQLNTATWGNLTGLGGFTPQYLAVSNHHICLQYFQSKLAMLG